MMKRGMQTVSVLAVAFMVVSATAQESFRDLVGSVPVGAASGTTKVQVPFIVWGGDVATFHANGGLTTKAGTIYHKQGLSLNLVPGDDFAQQVRDYMAGKSPLLRGTFRMMGMASEVIGSDPRTKGVTILQMTWSAGDHMVARAGVKTVADLGLDGQVGAGAAKVQIAKIAPPVKGDTAEILQGSNDEIVAGLMGKIKELGLL